MRPGPACGVEGCVGVGAVGDAPACGPAGVEGTSGGALGGAGRVGAGIEPKVRGDPVPDPKLKIEDEVFAPGDVVAPGSCAGRCGVRPLPVVKLKTPNDEGRPPETWLLSGRDCDVGNSPLNRELSVRN
jgi:hypothetical protein